MKDKLRAHFLSLGPRRFVFGAVLVLVAMDFVFSYYLKLSWNQSGMTEQVIRMALAQQKLSLSELSADTHRELAGLLDKAFSAFVAIVLLNNFFFYVFYLLRRLWAQGYILFYTLSSAILNLLFLFQDDGLGVGWVVYNLLSSLLYLYLYLGVKLLKAETTIPAGGKKAR